MSILFNAPSERLSRSTALVAASSNYTCLFWFRQTAYPATIFIPWIIANTGLTAYAKIDYDINWGMVLKVSDGTTQVDGTNFFYPDDGTDHWWPLVYVREGDQHRFYVRGSLYDTLTLDISIASFTNMFLGGDGSSETDNFRLANFREWNSALTLEQLQLEIASSTPLVAAFTDTPLDGDLLDDSGNGHNWTDLGSVSYSTAPVIDEVIVFTEFSTGAYFKSLHDEIDDNGFTTFPDQSMDKAILEVKMLNYPIFTIGHIGGNFTTDGGIIVKHLTNDLNLKYYGNSTIVIERLEMPWNSPDLGYDNSNVVYDTWFPINLKARVRTSTFNYYNNYWNQDGKIEIDIRYEAYTVNYSRDNIYIKRSKELPDLGNNYLTFNYRTLYNIDNIWISSSYEWPEFFGAQDVPHSIYLMEYLNANRWPVPNWSENGVGPFLAAGGGLAGSSGFSGYPNAAWNPCIPFTGGFLWIYRIFTQSQWNAPGTITVGKLCSPDSGATIFNLTALAPMSPTTFTLLGGDEREFTDLPVGYYTVEELRDGIWYPVYLFSNDSEDNEHIEVHAGEDVSVIVLNETLNEDDGFDNGAQASGVYQLNTDDSSAPSYSATPFRDVLIDEGQNQVDTAIPSPHITTAQIGDD